MPYLKKRILELFIPELLLSVAFVTLIDPILGDNDAITRIVFTSICLFLFIFIEIRYLFGYWYAFQDKATYYKTNFTAYAILFAANIIMTFVGTGFVYTWLFLPYKLFVTLGIYKTISALLTHAIIAIVIYLVPIIAEKMENR